MTRCQRCARAYAIAAGLCHYCWEEAEMKNENWGECATCGGDWDGGNRDSPPYDNCTCEKDGLLSLDGEPDEAYERANAIYKDETGSEL